MSSKNVESEPNSNDSTPAKGEDKTFINKLLIQMKTQFNNSADKTEDEQQTAMADVVETIDGGESMEIGEEEDCEVSEEDNNSEDKPRIVLTFRKPKNKAKQTNFRKEVVLKRSSRRRSKDCNESVLQSAIARKEKSYNESNKPQRLTRQLKPTQKILDNIANAAKNKKPDEEGCVAKKSNKGLKNGKKLKDSEDSNSSLSSESSNKTQEESKLCRRSLRISTSRFKEDDADADLTDSSAPETNSFETPDNNDCVKNNNNPATRLCLCTENTKIFVSPSENETVYCTAIDSISGKTIGCNNLVNANENCLLRPSYRATYVILCDVHYNRMLRHNCCPTCGLFCTQGKFAECPSRHQFHRDCLVNGENNCPHCGLATTENDVEITMHSTTKPVLLPEQKHYNPQAKMSFNAVERNSPTLLKEEIVDLCLDRSVGDHEKYEIDDVLSSVRCNDVEKLSGIIASGQVHLNATLPDYDNGTVMHFAARIGGLPAVHLLRVAGAEIDTLDKERNTPLTLAITSFKNEVARYLIKAGASLTLKGTDGMTPIHLAAKCGNYEACDLLLEAGFSIRDYINSEDDGGWTPLIWACEHGHANIAKYLMNRGADLHRRDVEQNLALHWAAFSDSSHITECLLNCGSDVNSTNVHEDTPLHIAARQNNYDTLTVLLIRGADVTSTNRNGETPLDCATQCSPCYKAIALNVNLLEVTPAFVQKIILTSDISKGKETNPIQCINTVDDECEPTDYVYVPKNCFTADVEVDCKVATMQFCNCEEKCDGDDCVCGRNSLHCWYDFEGKLTLDFNYSDPPLIFECNDLCNCNVILCKNRVVQRGTTHYFQLFKTDCRGWSIRTVCEISKGSFVCEYVGEIITDEEAEQREDDSFLFDLDNRLYYRSNDNETYCIDAKNYGNFSRFINHSCDANLLPVRVFVDHHDLRFPRIALFAKRKIDALEELSFDYGEKFWSVKSKNFGCCCDAANCRYKMQEV